MPIAKQQIFTKSFWNRSRIIWAMVVGFCTSVPLVGGSLLVASRWADANIVSPYIVCKIDSVCNEREKPLKQDIGTMVNDMRFIRGCIEMSTSQEIQDKVIVDMRRDSILDNKYVNR